MFCGTYKAPSLDVLRLPRIEGLKSFTIWGGISTGANQNLGDSELRAITVEPCILDQISHL